MHSLYILFSIFPQMAFEATSRKLKLFVNVPISLDYLFKAIMLSFAEYCTIEESNSSYVLLWNIFVVQCFSLTGKHWFTLLCNKLTATHKHRDMHISIVNIFWKVCGSAPGIFMLGGIIIYVFKFFFPPCHRIYMRSFAMELM